MDDSDLARLTSLRAEAVSGDGRAIMVGVSGIVIGQAVVVTMLGRDAPPVFWIHVAAIALVIAASIGLLTARRLVDPNDADLIDHWLPVARKIGLFHDATMIASPWVWLPLAGPRFSDFIYLIYAWYLGVIAMFSNDNQADARLGLLGVPLSLSLCLLVRDGPSAMPFAIVFIGAGITLSFFERQRRQRQTAEFLQRIDSERAAADLLGQLEASRTGPPSTRAEPAHSHPTAVLTPRQIEVLRHVSRGLSNKQIARELNISPATVKVHIAQILAMTGAGNRTAAAVALLRREPTAEPTG